MLGVEQDGLIVIFLQIIFTNSVYRAVTGAVWFSVPGYRSKEADVKDAKWKRRLTPTLVIEVGPSESFEVRSWLVARAERREGESCSTYYNSRETDIENW